MRITKFNTKNEPVIIDLTVKRKGVPPSIMMLTIQKQMRNILKSRNSIFEQYMPKITKDIEDNKVTYKLECPDTIHLITAPK